MHAQTSATGHEHDQAQHRRCREYRDRRSINQHPETERIAGPLVEGGVVSPRARLPARSKGHRYCHFW
jgi:hypothetical protein